MTAYFTESSPAMKMLRFSRITLIDFMNEINFSKTLAILQNTFYRDVLD